MIATDGCRIGFENVGAVSPTTYTGTVQMNQAISSASYYDNSTTYNNIYYKDDQRDPAFQDNNPQSGGSNGKVYSVDGPGIGPPNADTWRARVNFFACLRGHSKPAI